MRQSTILHVEDDSNDVLLFQHACRKAGVKANLQTVTDGEEALAYLNGTDQFQNRAEHPFPTLLVLDLKLPRVSGFDLLTRVREDTRLRRLPVIVLTSSNREADVKRAYDLGANSFLVKPVAFEGLVRLAQSIQDYWLALNQRPVGT
jgi:CheY-like chemotaxis protein